MSTTGTAPARRMFRYVVPVDGVAWTFDLTGDPVHVGYSTVHEAVEFWAEHAEGAPRAGRHFEVFGTGDPLPQNGRHVGTCPRTTAGEVWHLYELVGDEMAATP
jgi:hypothetical protein